MVFSEGRKIPKLILIKRTNEPEWLHEEILAVSTDNWSNWDKPFGQAEPN